MRSIYSFYTDAFKIALQSILLHKLRAILTLIGIIIGVAAVVVVSAGINGLKTYVVDAAGKILGSNHFMITRMASMGRMSDEEFEKRNRRNKDIVWHEYEYVKENCQLCSHVGAQVGAAADLNVDGVEMPATRIIGITASMFDIEDKTLGEGRFFNQQESERISYIGVVGNDVKEKYFPHRSPIGEEIKVRGVPVKIVGVEAKRGSLFGESQDRHIYIPIALHAQLFVRTGGLQLHGKTVEAKNFKPALDEARQLLRNRRQLIGSDEDTFGMVNVDEFSSTMDQMIAPIQMVVLPITLIILVVGGIVVMNIMLVSVTERTFEVGLRKALGATRKQILLQFLIESALLCAVGGLLGLFSAVAITQFIRYMLEFPLTITAFDITLSVGISSIIGIIAGLYPAWKAAKLDPIIALTQT